jgi:hypothetical protein
MVRWGKQLWKGYFQFKNNVVGPGAKCYHKTLYVVVASSSVPDPGKIHPGSGSRIKVVKRHRNPDWNPQRWLQGKRRELVITFIP